jgi:hypothetical protein
VEEVKYPKKQSAKRLGALYLALNDSLVSAGEIAAIRTYEADRDAGTLVTYTLEEVKEHIAMRYVGRFRTRRLRKKHRDTLLALQRAKLRLQKGAYAT